MMLRALAPLTVLLLLAADDNKDAKKDADKLQGTWEVVSLKVGGKEAPKDALEQYRLTIKGDRMTHRAAQEGETEEVTFVLDPTKKPKTIDMTLQKGTDKGKVVLGIYAIEADTLKLCMNQPSLERPKDFGSEEGTRIGLIVLKRSKAK